MADVHACEGGAPPQLKNQDLCSCSSRGYDRLALGWIKGLPPIGAWQMGALERERGDTKWFGHTDVTWNDGARQDMLVVLRNIDNASEYFSLSLLAHIYHSTSAAIATQGHRHFKLASLDA